MLAEGGSLVVSTGTHTGRSPEDRYIVKQPATRIQSIGTRPISQSPPPHSIACGMPRSTT